MSTINIPDDLLKEAGLDEREALVEFACRLFDAGKLPLKQVWVLVSIPTRISPVITICLPKNCRLAGYFVFY